MPVEDLIRMAESVELYQNNMNDVLEIDTGDPVEAPLCERAERALTAEFVERVKEYARRDAEANIYMQSGYIDFVTAYTKARVSPERDSAAARVSAFLEDCPLTDGVIDHHVLCLVEPLYFVDVTISYHQKIANVYDENGLMIAGYNSMDGHWTSVPAFAEKQFGYVSSQIYAEAFREEQAKRMNDE